MGLDNIDGSTTASAKFAFNVAGVYKVCYKLKAGTYAQVGTSTITVSGVASTRSIRSAFRANTDPERRVSEIIAGHHPCAAFRRPSVAIRECDRPPAPGPEESGADGRHDLGDDVRADGAGGLSA